MVGIMRTISKNLMERLVAQAEEAEIRGLTKVASHLTEKIEISPVRSDSDDYTYSKDSLKSDVESKLWDAAIRVSDFHNKSIDSKDVQDVIETYAEKIIDELQVIAGIRHGVGNYEPTLPGEVYEKTEIEVEEE